MARDRRDDFRRYGTSQYESTRRTVQQLREMGEHVVEAAKRALKEGVDIVIEDAKSRCPVDTGKLKDSIRAISKEGGAVYHIEANAKNDKGIPYGQFVEFSPFHMFNGHKYETGPKPFLYPAMDAHRNEVYQKVQNAVRAAIRGTS